MPNPAPCGPSPCVPVVTNVPGPQGLQGAVGPTGLTGPQGPAGTAAVTPSTYATYGNSTTSTYQLSASGAVAAMALLNLSPTYPAVTILVPGNYMLQSRVRVDGVGVTLTAQTLTIKLRCVNNTVADIANTTRVFDFVPCSDISGTMAEMTTPPVIYAATLGDQIQVWGQVSAVTGGGTLVCVEADIIAVQIV